MGTTNTLDINNRVTNLEKAVNGLTASDIMLSDGVTSVEDALDDVDDKIPIYFDSDEITITADANSTALGTVTFSETIPNHETLAETIVTKSLSGSWNIQLTYLDKFTTIVLTNYGTSANTWKGFIRKAIKKI